MRRLPLFLILIALISVSVKAQYSSTNPMYQTGAPSGTCYEKVIVDRVTGIEYTCVSGTWTAQVGSITGSGTANRLTYWTGTSVLSALGAGTSTQVLHGNASGAPSFSAVVLTTDVSGILPGANGGTGNGFFAVSGPTSSLKTYALPDISTTICTTNSVCAGYQASLGYTSENVSNKDTDGTLAANSDTKYPSQKAVKTYVDAHSGVTGSGTQNTLAKFGSGGTSVGDSRVFDDGTDIVLNASSDINGEVKLIAGDGGYVTINDAGSTASAGAQFFNATGVTVIGDINGNVNSTTLTIADAAKTITSTAGGDTIVLDGVAHTLVNTISLWKVGATGTEFQIDASGRITTYDNAGDIENGNILIGSTSASAFVKSSITPGTGITITNGAGSITIADDGLANVSAQTGTVTVAASDTGKTYTNEGASALAIFNLPTAATGLQYTFVVQDADGIKVVANTGDTIRLSSSVSAAAGNAQSTTIGSVIVLVAINATEWIAITITGTWAVT